MIRLKPPLGTTAQLLPDDTGEYCLFSEVEEIKKAHAEELSKINSEVVFHLEEHRKYKAWYEESEDEGCKILKRGIIASFIACVSLLVNLYQFFS